jgi:hypothetical protein
MVVGEVVSSTLIPAGSLKASSIIRAALLFASAEKATEVLVRAF